MCFDIWWFKQVNNSETGFSGHHCDFEQHVPCLAVHVCMNSVKFVLKAPGASILWGRYYSVIMCRLIWGALLLGGALLIGTLRYLISYFLGKNDYTVYMTLVSEKRSSKSFTHSVVRLPQIENQTYRLIVRPEIWPPILTLAMTLTLNFQDQVVDLLYRMGKWSNCCEMEIHIDRMLGLKCGQQFWPWPWPWPWTAYNQ